MIRNKQTKKQKPERVRESCEDEEALDCLFMIQE